MVKFSDIVNILDLEAEVYIRSTGEHSYMIFNGELRNLPLEAYLHAKDMPVYNVYTAAHEVDEDECVTTYLNIIVKDVE